MTTTSKATSTIAAIETATTTTTTKEGAASRTETTTAPKHVTTLASTTTMASTTTEAKITTTEVASTTTKTTTAAAEATTTTTTVATTTTQAQTTTILIPFESSEETAVEPRTAGTDGGVILSEEPVEDQDADMIEIPASVDPYDSFITLEAADYQPAPVEVADYQPAAFEAAEAENYDNTIDNMFADVRIASPSGPSSSFYYTTIFHNNFGKFSKVLEYYPQPGQLMHEDPLHRFKLAQPRQYELTGPLARPTYTIMRLPGQAHPIIYYAAHN